MEHIHLCRIASALKALEKMLSRLACLESPSDASLWPQERGHAHVCAGLLRQQAEQAATALSALPSVSVADVKAHVRPLPSPHASQTISFDSYDAWYFQAPSISLPELWRSCRPNPSEMWFGPCR